MENLPIEEILKLGQVPMGALTLYVLYMIMTKLERVITRIDTVLEMMTDGRVKAPRVP